MVVDSAGGMDNNTIGDSLYDSETQDALDSSNHPEEQAPSEGCYQPLY
jgi:hypothetical protein